MYVVIRYSLFLPPSDPKAPAAHSGRSPPSAVTADQQVSVPNVNRFSGAPFSEIMPDQAAPRWFVCLPRASLAFVESGSTIVFRESLTGSMFTVQGNRKAVSSCSCGVSFGVEETF